MIDIMDIAAFIPVWHIYGLIVMFSMHGLPSFDALISGSGEEPWSLRLKICPRPRSAKVTCPPNRYLYERCKIPILCVNHLFCVIIQKLLNTNIGQISSLNDHGPCNVPEGRGIKSPINQLLYSQCHVKRRLDWCH